MNSKSKLIAVGLLSLFTLSFSACYESNTEDAPPSLQQTAVNGKRFYNENCAVCHAAGSDDTTTAFNATDLATVNMALITSDLSSFGGSYQLMGQFANIPGQQVEELKAYLDTL